MNGGRKTQKSGGVRGARRRAVFAFFGKIAVLAAGFAGGAAAWFALHADRGELALAIVGALAVVGVFELLVALRRTLTGGVVGDSLAAAALSASSDGMAVVEDGERLAEFNGAYQKMCRSGTDAPPTPERFLARIPGSQPVVAELLNAIADGTPRTGTIPFATGPEGQRLVVSVHPLGQARRVLWALRVAGDESAVIATAPEAKRAAAPPLPAALPLAPAPAPASQPAPPPMRAPAPPAASSNPAPAASAPVNSAPREPAPSAPARHGLTMAQAVPLPVVPLPADPAPPSAPAPTPSTPAASAPSDPASGKSAPAKPAPSKPAPSKPASARAGSIAVSQAVPLPVTPPIDVALPEALKQGLEAAAPVPSPVIPPVAPPVAVLRPAPAPAFEVAPPRAGEADIVAIWERAPAGLLRFRDGRVRDVNLTFCRMLGYALADWAPEGRDLREVVVRQDVERLEQTLKGSAEATLRLGLVRKDGGTLAALVRLVRLQPRSDGTAAVAVPLEGLGEGPGLPAAAAPADLFFVRAPLALALVEPQGRIRAANAAFTRLFGAAAAGRSLGELLADASGTQALLSSAARGGEPPAPCEVTLSGAGGRSARLYAAALGGAGGEIALCAIDTTEQKQLETQFNEAQKLQAVGHLAGGMAHDFNNMLTAIIGFSDLLLTKHRPSDPSFPDIMQIKQNANRAAGLVRQLLAFSRRQTLRPKVIELTDVISDVTQLLRRLIGERITLEVQHARELWPVKVDVNQFEQVIINLVVNARDAMPEGGTLTLRTANVPAADCAAYGQRLPEADYVLVEVSDTGTGIAPEIMGKIFEPFFSTKEVGKGTGLGLSTVYGIVEQTGGTILAESELGRGTAFRVFLPRHLGAVEAEAAPAAEPEAKPADLTGHGRVLLVEDEDAVRAFATQALTNRGYEVLAAASGAEALEVMDRRGQKIDIVISDVVMPEMDGPSLLKALRARDPNMKMIFISGYAEEAFARNLPPSEHFTFLPKPFSLKQLVETVTTTLRGG